MPSSAPSVTAPSPVSGIVEMAGAYQASAVLFAALDLDLFGRLARHGSATAASLAAELNGDRRGLGLLLDGCTAIGLLEKQGDLYRNGAAAAACLVPGAPHDLSRAIRYNQDVYAAWGRLSQLARTGKPVEPPALHLGDDPERTRRFVLAMHGRALGIGRSVVPLLDLSEAGRLLDVGGGPGTYAALMARAAPRLACTVLDLSAVVAVARELIEAEGLSARVGFIAGDYHETPFPPGQDVVTCFGMLHQESPEAIRELLQRAHAALNPGGRVYVLDLMTDATHTRPRASALFALNMALTTEHGWVFSEDELTGWLHEAGFERVKAAPVPPPMPHTLMEARKPR